MMRAMVNPTLGLPQCLGLWAETKRRSEKPWSKSERPNGEYGTKVLRLAKETASRRIRLNGFGTFSRIVASVGSEIWLSSRRQLIPCCTDKTCSLSLLGMCSVAMVQSVPLLRLRARGECHKCDAPCPRHPQRRLKNGSLRPAKSASIIYSRAVALRAAVRGVPGN